MKKLLLISALATLASASFGQYTLTSFADGLGYNQNFDSVLPSGTATVAAQSSLTATNGLLNGLTTGVTASATVSPTPFAFADSEWSYNYALAATGSSTHLNSNDAGGTNSGSFKNYGVAGATDRALGSLASGSSAPGTNTGYQHIGLSLLNGTGSSTGLVAIDYDLEKWRNGGTLNNVDGFRLSYALFKGGTGYTASLLSTESTWGTSVFFQTVDSLGNLSADTAGQTITGPASGSTAGGVDGNDAANKIRVKARLQLFADGLLYEPGDLLVVRFSDLNNTGNDNGIALDNLQVVPEPASMAVLGLGILGLARRRRNK